MKWSAIVCLLMMFGATSLAAESNAPVVIDFEKNTGGLTGPITREPTAGVDGSTAGKVVAELAEVKQSAWVTLSKPLAAKHPIQSLSFWIKSEQAKQITVRIVDSTKQTFQQRPAVTPDGQWQRIVIDNFEAGPGFQSFGGAGDKKVHWPATQLALIVEKNGLAGGSGTVLLDEVRIEYSSAKLVDIVFPMLPSGNVFYTSEPVRIPVETIADEIEYAITDYWGKPVTSQTVPVKDEQALIETTIDRPGYFEVRLTARSGGEAVMERTTSLIVTTSIDLSKVKDSPFGLMTHFAQNWSTQIIPVLAKAGIKHVRDEQYWSSIETKPQEFVFPEKFVAYMDQLRSHQIDPLIALTFGNKLYDNTPDAPTYGNAPYTDAGRAAYARYCQEVVRKYGDQLKAVEIWNEYNGTFGKGPAAADKARYYAEMLAVAYPAIKSVKPDITVVGVSAVAVPMPYFEDLFKRGSLKYMDAISLHPYRTQTTPEGLERQLTKLQDLIKKYNDGKPMPIWITELGWYVKKPDGRSDIVVTEADQARYLVRANVLSLSAGVEKFYWYHARDDGAFPNSGVLRGDKSPMGAYAPKPAFAALAELTRQLTPAAFEAKEETINDDVYSIRFTRGGESLRVMWSLEPRTLAVKASGPIVVTDIMGVSTTLTPQAGAIELSLTDSPLYVTGPITELPPRDPMVGTQLADAVEDFSERQGTGGWSYGFLVGNQYDSSAWQPMPEYRTTIWGYDWVGKHRYLKISPGVMHPEFENGTPVWAITRYRSPTSGKLLLKGTFNRPAAGDGVVVHIFVDGKDVWHKQLGGGEPTKAAYDVTVTVEEGSLIDFAVDPRQSLDFDATMFSAKLIRLP